MTFCPLLGGAERGKTRPRGFVPWKPQAVSRVLLGQVQSVLTEYAIYLPMTCRQVFYRLVGAHGYEKSEQAYQRLIEMLNRARRARIIAMDDIRDGGGQYDISALGYDDAEHFMASLRSQAECFRLDWQQGQLAKLVLACEAEGMVPQLESIAADYGVPLISGGGFESTTKRHEIARAIADEDRRLEFLHIGDHDPSGAHLFLALAEDVQAYLADYGGDARFTRLAVTPEQIDSLALPTAPPKASDHRAFEGETCQAEAIPPDVLAAIVREAIESRIDTKAYRNVLRREREVRHDLVRRLAR
jgi:hypothetical protein